jgi:adenylate cyclase
VVLDERHPTAHWALAGINLWSRQHDEVIRKAERAISLNPNSDILISKESDLAPQTSE